MDSPKPDLATQVLDSESPLTSPDWSVPDSPLMGSPEIDLTLPLNDTLPVEEATQVLGDQDSGEETQVLYDLDFGEIGTTQVLDSEDEGSQVLTENEGGSDSDFQTELVDGNETEVLDDLDGENCDSESLHTCGFVAAYKINPKGTDHEAGCIQGNSQSEKEIAHKASEVSGIRGLATNDMQGRETVSNHCTQNYNGVTGRRDERKCRVARPTVRRLFTDVAPDNDTSLPEFETNDHEYAGLSYVLSQPSQEPGDLSNALNIVDKYISINKEGSPQERNWGSARKDRSPLVSSAKGTKMLALKLRYTVGEAGIFDWDDNQEDEGGGYFFSKRKEELLGVSCHAHGSYTQPKNQRPRNAKKGRDTMDRLGKKDDDLSLCQKMKRLTRSDSRLVVDKSNEDEKKQHVYKTRTRKNLSERLNAMRNPGTSSGQLEETGVMNNCDVGIDKMASEAMETLDCEETYNHNNGGVFQDATNDTKGCTRDEKKKVHSKRASHCRSSDSGGTLRRSGRMKKLDTSIETSRKISADENMTGFASDSKTKGKERKMNAVKNLDTSTDAIENKVTDRRFSKSTEGVNSVSAVNKTDLRDADRLYKSSTSSGNISAMKEQIQEDYRIVTPVRPRTRKSFAVNPLKSSRSCSDTGDGTGEMEVRETKKGQRGPNVDESDREGQMYKLLSDLTGSVTMDKPIQQEPSNYISHEEIAKTSYGKKDICRYPLRKRTHQNMANNINGFAKLDIQSTGQGIEANEQSTRKQKKLKTDVRNTSIKIDHKRITRSSLHYNPSSVSSDKKCDGSMTRQSVPNSALNDTSINCSSPVMTDKLVQKDKDTFYSSKECGVSSIEGRDTKARSDMSPVERVKRPVTTCFTPSSNCTTPVNVASPVIVGNNLTCNNRSGKNSLSRSSLKRALNKLDANEVIHSPTSKDLRKKKDMANVRVLFSRHLDEDIIRQQKKILLRLGASIACSSAEATHFVANNFVRTLNMLESIASGKPVVTHLWLESCGQASCLIDEKNYILRDFKKEKEIGFSMPVSLARAGQSLLLEGKRVYLTQNVKPNKELIASLVKAVGGQVVERVGRSATRDDKVPDDLLVLSSEEDYAICVPLIEKGAVICSSDLLLNGIVIQKLEYERHRLFSDHVRKTRSTTWLRKRDGDQFIPLAKHK